MNLFLAVLANVVTVPLAVLVALRLPHWFVWLYLLVYTRFLGFFDIMLLSAEGVFNPLATLCLGAIGAGLVLAASGRRLERDVTYVLLVFAAAFFFGLVYPVANGDSDLAAAFVDGKEMLALGFLPYLLLQHTDHLKLTLVRGIKIIGFVLAAEVLGALWLGLAPPALEPIEEGLGIRHGVHVYSSMFIFLALVLHLYHEKWRWEGARIRWLLLALFYSVGLLMQGHRSLVFGLLVTVVGVAVLDTTARTVYKILLVACLLGLAGVSGQQIEVLEDRIVAPVQEFLRQEGAIAARQHTNVYRYAAIESRPLFGFGFIDEKSALGREMAESAVSRFDQSYGTVDAGYVDLRIRFGWVGTIAVSAVWGLFLIAAWRRRPEERGRRRESAALIAFLASYYLVAITWSVFTYDFGLFAAAVAIYLLVDNRGPAVSPEALLGSQATAEAGS